MPGKKASKSYHELVGLSVIIAGIAAGLILVQQVQLLRRRAATPEGTATVYLTPESGTYRVGDTIPVSIHFDVSQDVISGVTTRVVYGYTGSSSPLSVDSIEIGKNIELSSDWTCPTQDVHTQNGYLIVDIACGNTNANGFTRSEDMLLATINYSVDARPLSGKVSFGFDAERSIITDKQTNEDILSYPTSTAEFMIGDFTGPVLYFVPSETYVPLNATGSAYDIYLDTWGYEVNGAVFEIKFDTDVIAITDVVEGDIMRLVVDKSVEGGTAYLSVIIADQTKPFVGVGRAATVIFDTFTTATTTHFTFEPNTQIHTKALTSNILDKALSGTIHIGLSPTPTPNYEPTPTPTNVPTATPTSGPLPTPTIDPNAYCTDTDSGTDVENIGTVDTDKGSFTDYCESYVNLVEYYCVSDPEPRYTSETVDCSSIGAICFDGRCIDPVKLTPTPTPIPTICPLFGDANNDCVVDGQDFVIWLNNFGTFTSLGPAAGDFDSSGFVDGEDYAYWFIYFQP